MFSYSNSSAQKLATCDQRLQDIMNEAIKHVDIGITCGYRDKAGQDEAFNNKKSKLQFPNSKHNVIPSKAVDFVPFVDLTIVWNDKELIGNIAFFIKGIAAAKGINVRLGYDWNGNFKASDETFMDAFHIELID